VVPIAEQRPGDLLTNTIKANMDQSRDQIVQNPDLKPAIAAGRLKVVTGYYGLDDGTMSFT
jgi:carbonic anhydrase